jgi:hypothetical protein
MATKPATQLQWLRHDLAEYKRILDAHQTVFAPLADLRDLDEQGRLIVLTDLFFRIFQNAAGLCVLLEHDVRTPALVVTRALFEATGTLGYLVAHQNPQFEALVLLAHSHLSKLAHFPDQKDLVAEIKANLKRMPKRVVVEANKRKKNRPYTWSGKTIRKVMTSGAIEGYDFLYGFLSAEVHASSQGELVKVVPGDTPGTANMNTGLPILPADVEALANYARRALYDSLLILWNQLKGPNFKINTEDPKIWLGNRR